MGVGALAGEGGREGLLTRATGRVTGLVRTPQSWVFTGPLFKCSGHGHHMTVPVKGTCSGAEPKPATLWPELAEGKVWRPHPVRDTGGGPRQAADLGSVTCISMSVMSHFMSD